MLHSPSSISLAMRCKRAWWHRYRDKLKPPELTWEQVKRMQRAFMRLPVGARSKALGKEVHRLAETYLAVTPERVARAKRGSKHYIDWNDLPGQCLAELAHHLPPAGSVPRKNLERRVTVEVDGVQFQGLIDLIVEAGGAVLESYDHKTTGDIRAYALLPDTVAKARREAKRSLKDDLQACVYVLARASNHKRRLSGAEEGSGGCGGLVRWNYTETKRRRISLPVVQYIPTPHARTVVAQAAQVAKQVEAFETIEDATPDTTACTDYGGCWYRAEGHCAVRRNWPQVFNKLEREKREEAERKATMGKQNTLNAVRRDTAKANEREEAAAAAAKAKAKRKAPVAEIEGEDDEDDEDEAPESEAPESEPAPAPKKKRAAKPAPEPELEDEDDDAPESEAAPATSARTDAKATLEAATAAPDHIIQFFDPAQFPKGEARVMAMGFSELAAGVADLDRNPERAQALRHLLAARDCAVRAVVGK